MADLIAKNSHGEVISRPPTKEGYAAIDAFVKESVQKGATVSDGTGDTFSRMSYAGHNPLDKKPIW